MSKKLAGKAALVRPDIDEMFEGLNGRALNASDLETMFQLIYPDVHAATSGREAFRTATEQLNAALANRQALPGSGVRGRAHGRGQPESRRAPCR